MNWVKIILANVGGTLAFFLLFDVTVANLFSGVLGLDAMERRYRILHPHFDHTLAQNYDGTGIWGQAEYRVCTDDHGFKTGCGSNSYEHYDIAFIGDSFTEGIGLAHEDTFVGLVEKRRDDLRIANLGVASYSPSIYRRKVEYYLEQGLSFDHVIVFVDISDIQNEAVKYISTPEGPIRRRDALVSSGTKVFFMDRFPLTLALYRFVQMGGTKFSGSASAAFDPAAHYERVTNLPLSEWTYNPKSDAYGDVGIEGGIQIAVEEMERLYNLLSERGIEMSVGVYPWPAQIAHDNLTNNRQVQLWQDFCVDRCSHFFNAFETFQPLLEAHDAEDVISRYYIEGDAHFNESGNNLIADLIDRELSP